MQLGNCAHLLGVPDEEELEGHTLQFVRTPLSEISSTGEIEQSFRLD